LCCPWAIYIIVPCDERVHEKTVGRSLVGDQIIEDLVEEGVIA